MPECNYQLRGTDVNGSTVCIPLVGDRMDVGRPGAFSLHYWSEKLQLSVSRQHAVLEKRGEDWVLTDLGSSNGTFVNRARIQQHRLSNGDVIRFGKVVLKFEVVANEYSSEAETNATTMRDERDMTRVRENFKFSSLIGRSKVLMKAMQQAALAAKSEATVLVIGESGTGKELFSRFIYSESRRSQGKFLAVNCGAIAESLQDSTLFGHEKGAFTGADRQRKGLFEEADKGTLFLDEVGELSLEMQVKLLRVLQEREFMRLGSNEPIKTDVRIICATNRDLEARVSENKFREDLYYRLNVIRIHLPPLRERKEDIPDLVNHFAAKYGGENAKMFSDRAMGALTAYSWPGNVRQLENAVLSSMSMSLGDVIEVDDLPQKIIEAVKKDGIAMPSQSKPTAGVDSTLADIVLTYIQEVYEDCDGNKSETARKLGISRSTLDQKLAQISEREKAKLVQESDSAV